MLGNLINKVKDYYLDKREEKLKYEFLPSALEIEQTPASPLGRNIIIGIFLIILISIVYASMSKVDMVAVARGKVIPNGRVKVIQVPTEGVVTAIHVEEGDRVKKDDLLVELDKTMKQVDEDSIKSNISILEAEKNILEKYINQKDIVELKKYIETVKVDDEIKNDLIDFIISKKENFENKKSILTLSVTQGQSDIEIANSQLDKLKQQNEILRKTKTKLGEIKDSSGIQENELKKLEKSIEIAKNEENQYKALYEEDAVSKQEYIEKSNTVNLLEKEYEVQKSKAKDEKDTNYLKYKQIDDDIKLGEAEVKKQTIQIDNMEIKLKQEKEKLNNLEKEDKEDILRQIVEKQKQIQENQNLMQKAKKTLEYQNIKSPVDGVVSMIGVNTIGNVVSPTQSIMSIVPDDTKLIIEATVQNKDIGFIYEGQEVSVKVDTFSFQKYGTLKGEVEKISADAYEDEKIGLVYKVKIRLIQDTLNVEGKKVKISSGMGVVAEIKTGKRRVIEFLVEPFVKYIDESFKLR